jgi:hypothetical protein
MSSNAGLEKGQMQAKKKDMVFQKGDTYHDEAGPEVPTIDWEYSNLIVEMHP